MIKRFVVPLVITVLFCVGIVQCLYVFAAQQASWRCRISTLLHFVMVVAMIVMAWSAGTHPSTDEPVVFFGVAAAWFVAMAITDASGVRQRMTSGYHAVMMTAMAWMFAEIHTGPPAGHSGHSQRARRAGVEHAHVVYDRCVVTAETTPSRFMATNPQSEDEV
jgi:hypothetical protein